MREKRSDDHGQTFTVKCEYQLYPITKWYGTIEQADATTGGKLIPITRKSGKAKDSESDSVAGRKHSVTVSCEADDRDSKTWDYLFSLERTPCHLILTFRNGARAFVQASEDTYTCEVSRENAKTNLDFKIENLMGIQLITT